MWNLITIPLVSGVGNTNLVLYRAQILGAVAIPAQAAINSGVTKLVISHILPDPPSTAFTVLTLTTITTPYFEIPQRVPVNPANVAQTNPTYQLVGSLNLSITGGVGSNIANIWLLTDD